MNNIILITTSSKQEAENIINELLTLKLIACANIINDIKSFFWWKDRVENASECLIILKSDEKYFSEIEKIVKSIHSYEVPEIIALPIVIGSREYMDWINKTIK